MLRKLKDIFRRYCSQPLGRLIEEINRILRGWVQYFAIGDLESVLFLTFATGSRRRFGVTWPEPGSVRASAGSGGVSVGCTAGWGSSMGTTWAGRRRRKRPQLERSHNPWCERCRSA
ncbi:MAG: group II intron maturase-specific domain-containing protein [Gammaproteobacteria bacterium]